MFSWRNEKKYQYCLFEKCLYVTLFDLGIYCPHMMKYTFTSDIAIVTSLNPGPAEPGYALSRSRSVGRSGSALFVIKDVNVYQHS